MSSCAASCSICCHLALYASATSASSPTATAPRCCRCAGGCSADHCKTQLRRQQRPQIRIIHPGIAPSAVGPCASSNGSPLRNSCLLATSTRPVRSMKIDPHPRPLPLLRRKRGSLVSFGQDTLDASFSSLDIRPRRTKMLFHSAIQSPDNAQLSLCLIPLHPFIDRKSTRLNSSHRCISYA